MARPRAIVIRAPGTNCDEETVLAWQRAGATVETWHVNRLIETPAELDRFQIVTIPGGFSYGDDLGAGRILATRISLVLGRCPAPISRPGRTLAGDLQRVPGIGSQRALARVGRPPARPRWPTMIRAASRPGG